jgi:hypothetical protein
MSLPLQCFRSTRPCFPALAAHFHRQKVPNQDLILCLAEWACVAALLARNPTEWDDRIANQSCGEIFAKLIHR